MIWYMIVVASGVYFLNHCMMGTLLFCQRNSELGLQKLLTHPFLKYSPKRSNQHQGGVVCESGHVLWHQCIHRYIKDGKMHLSPERNQESQLIPREIPSLPDQDALPSSCPSGFGVFQKLANAVYFPSLPCLNENYSLSCSFLFLLNYCMWVSDKL